MSSSTSAKSSSEEAGASKEVDKTSNPKSAEDGAAEASASKEKSGLNGAASSAAEKPKDEAGPSAQDQTNASRASRPSDEKQDAAHASEQTGETAEKPAATARTDAPETPDSDKDMQTGAPPAGAAEKRDNDNPAAAPDDAEAKADAADQAAKQGIPADTREAEPETVEDEEEDTLDLRALFASSEPDFASPTDTFELARGAKSAHRDPQPVKPAPRTDASIYDREPPPDMPPLDVTPSEGQSFMARGLHGDGASPGASGGKTAETGDFETDDPNGDPLADAVQSALRSVYGEDSSAGEDDFRHEGGAHESEGPVLQWAGAGAAEQSDHDDPYRLDDDADADAFAEPQRDSGIDEETTEAVLSYLYEHMDSDSPVRSSEQNDDEPETDDRPDRAHDHDRRGYDQWLDGAAPSHSAAPDRAESGNYDGYREDRDATPAYARAEPDEPRSLVPASAEAADFAPPMDLSLDSSEASGKLLGAAGLGLIGGIAVAGVAAVFVFNSFVTQEEPSARAERTQARLSDSAPSSSAPATVATVAESPQKDDSRLGAPDDTQAIVNEPARTAAIVTPDSAPATSVAPPASQDATPATSETAAEPRIDASDVTGRADQPIALQLAVAQSDEESFVRIVGLPEGVRLSAGVDTGSGSWLLSAGRAGDLSLNVPDAYEGNFLLEAQVLASDARTPISDRVVFQVSVAGAPAETRTTALAPDTARAVAEQPPSIIDRARSLMSAGDVLAAREALRPEAEGGNAKAALALGQTFDPMTFNPDSPANAGPDATEAFRWYQKAVELGAPEGEKRIADLKSWLLQ